MFYDITEKLDQPIVRQLLSACLGDKSPKGIDAALSKYPGEIFYGWMEAGKPLGICGFRVLPDKLEICHIAVAETARREGIGSAMVYALREKYDKTIEAETDDDAVVFYRKCGFQTTESYEEYGGEKHRRWTCVLEKEMTLDKAIQLMAQKIALILTGDMPTIYIFGSVALDDFKPGWSDIDILVLTKHEISEQQADMLVGLRQSMLQRYLGNPYFRLFEGGMLSLDAFLNNSNERAVYWGTDGQRIADGYKMCSFGMAELIDSGILICGDDVRQKMQYPTYTQFRDDILHHVKVAREHGTTVGWLLDIARGIYTLRTGKIIAKTAAGEWALANNICPDADAMQKAVSIRKEPTKYPDNEKQVDNVIIQQFADVIESQCNAAFWQVLDRLVAESKIIIDRPKGSRHPKYPSFIYPVDYGYIDGTTSMDGGGIDIWKGTNGEVVNAIICTIDLLKRDSEMKILIGCSEDEKQAVLKSHNSSENMKGILIAR